MQKKIKVILSCIVTLCLTVGLLGYLTNIMERKASDSKYADFFSQKKDFNVLFMGTSKVINGVYPMELWDDYGIVSYNMGGHSNQLATTYWTMENALNYTKPKLIVIDCFTVSSLFKSSDIFSFMHLSFDAFPLSVTKIKAVWDLLDDPVLDETIENGKARKSDEPRTKIGLLWDYSVYHNRWEELEKEDFETPVNPEKGAESRIHVSREQLNKIDPSQKMKAGTVGEDYLKRMIEDCQSRGIDVLLTYLPSAAIDQQQEEANYIYDIADEYGVDYLNFLDMDLIDYHTDLYDESHLNPSGARKITDYLGEYISAHYPVVDQRNNSDYDFWNQDYQEYINLKNKNLRSEKKITNYLMLLSGEKADIVLDVQNKKIYKNKWIMELLKNIGVEEKDITEETDFIIKLNDSDKAVIINDFRDNNKTLDTAIGTVQLLYDDQNGEGCYKLYLNGVEYLNGNKNNTGLNIIVRRGKTVADQVRFIYTVDPKTNNVNVISTSRNKKDKS